jgi:hypothetical protein
MTTSVCTLADRPVSALLRDGTIRLLSCRWLLEEAEEALRPHNPDSGLPVLRRKQEMPEEAFLPPEEAARVFDNGKRQVLVLSYGWLLATEPDPRGERLALIRRFLATLPDAAECGFFMDQVCLPQPPRTKEEDKVFFKGLKNMGKLYASVTGATVVQIKSVPSRPAEMEGRLSIRGLAEAVEQEQLQAALSAHGEVRLCELQRGGTGSAEVRYATHAEALGLMQAQTAAARLPSIGDRQMSRGLTRGGLLTAVAPSKAALPGTQALLKQAVISESYNSRRYEERGWCCFEEGLAQVVVAHLAQQASEGRLPKEHSAAEQTRPKLIALGDDGAAQPHKAEHTPNKLLETLQARIEAAKFIGEEDRSKVNKQVLEFMWLISRGVEQAVEQRLAQTTGLRWLLFGTRRKTHPLPPAETEAVSVPRKEAWSSD